MVSSVTHFKIRPKGPLLGCRAPVLAKPKPCQKKCQEPDNHGSNKSLSNSKYSSNIGYRRNSSSSDNIMIVISVLIVVTVTEICHSNLQ